MPDSKDSADAAKLTDLSMADLRTLLRSEISRSLADLIRPGGGAGSHVNSGPPGFVNGGGHANFDPGKVGSHVNSGPPGFVNGGGHANFDPASSGAHVNSGPPGFVNGGGHANFDPGKVGSHVNSGPPGFVNGGGHANFDPAAQPGRLQTVTTLTLAGGVRVQLPATGAVDVHVAGMRIQR